MKKVFTSFATIVIGLIAYTSLSSNSGGSPNGASAGCSCHGAQSNNTTLGITTTIPASGWVANATYTVTATVTNSTKVEAGFVCNPDVGTFLNPVGNINASGTTATHITPATMAAGTATFVWEWKAPASGTSVGFTLAGNATDNNGGTGGDAWAKGTYTFAAAAVATAPTITGISTTNITATSATINGTANANGSQTALAVNYGLTTAYGTIGTCTPSSVTGNAATPFTCQLNGLLPGKTYHYQLAGISLAGNTLSTDYTFTTPFANPIVSVVKNSNLQIFPNPANSIFTIKNGITPVKNITLIAANGVSIPMQGISNGVETMFDCTNLAAGNYLIIANVNGIYSQSKICIIKE